MERVDQEHLLQETCTGVPNPPTRDMGTFCTCQSRVKIR